MYTGNQHKIIAVKARPTPPTLLPPATIFIHGTTKHLHRVCNSACAAKYATGKYPLWRAHSCSPSKYAIVLELAYCHTSFLNDGILNYAYTLRLTALQGIWGSQKRRRRWPTQLRTQLPLPQSLSLLLAIIGTGTGAGAAAAAAATALLLLLFLLLLLLSV